jgi:hypothetical protein
MGRIRDCGSCSVFRALADASREPARQPCRRRRPIRGWSRGRGCQRANPAQLVGGRIRGPSNRRGLDHVARVRTTVWQSVSRSAGSLHGAHLQLSRLRISTQPLCPAKPKRCACDYAEPPARVLRMLLALRCRKWSCLEPRLRASSREASVSSQIRPRWAPSSKLRRA